MSGMKMANTMSSCRKSPQANASYVWLEAKLCHICGTEQRKAQCLFNHPTTMRVVTFVLYFLVLYVVLLYVLVS